MPPYYNSLPSSGMRAGAPPPAPPLYPYPHRHPAVAPAQILVADKVRIIAFMVTWAIGLIFSGITYDKSQSTATSYYSSNTYLILLIVNLATGLVYILMNIAIGQIGPNNLNLSCRGIFLYSPNNSSNSCCAGFCIAFVINIIFLIALISFIKALWEKCNER
jgi:hypothetical protein